MFIHEITASFALTILIYSINRGHVVSESHAVVIFEQENTTFHVENSFQRRSCFFP